MATYTGLAGSGGQPPTERIVETIPRPQIVLALGLTLILVNMFTSDYWLTLWRAIIGPKRSNRIPTDNPVASNPLASHIQQGG